jgi:hypothetical protein
MASGSGIIGLFNPTQALTGRTQMTATVPAASRGTRRASAWPIKYGPIRCFRFSGSVRGRRQHPNRSQHQDRARHLRLARVRDFHLKGLSLTSYRHALWVVFVCIENSAGLTGHRPVATELKTRALLLGRFLFDVFNDVADSLKFFRVFVRHFDPKFFFKSHHQFDNVERVCP